jgi:hypothetical protein
MVVVVPAYLQFMARLLSLEKTRCNGQVQAGMCCLCQDQKPFEFQLQIPVPPYA